MHLLWVQSRYHRLALSGAEHLPRRRIEVGRRTADRAASVTMDCRPPNGRGSSAGSGCTPYCWRQSSGSTVVSPRWISCWASMSYKGVAGPAGSCTPETFARAEQYRPGPEDIFVVTQMKCGTTWMQHVVYEVLNRGNGNLVARRHRELRHSPRIEGRRSVPIDQAPLIGAERPSRIIKTHLPAQLCPASPQARYIYVARHPVSCYARLCGLRGDQCGPDGAAPRGVRGVVLLAGIHVVGHLDRPRPGLVGPPP